MNWSRFTQKPVGYLIPSYLSLRFGIGFIAFLLPVAVLLIGLLNNVSWKSSISAYYHVNSTRDVFVAALSIIGVFLITYRGYNKYERWFSSVQGMAALGIAFFPTTALVKMPEWVGWVHYLCAGILFVLMAFFAFVFFPKNNSFTPMTEAEKANNNRIYVVCGALITFVLVVLVARYAFFTLQGQKLPEDHLLFLGEWLGIWAFAIAWLTKGHALKLIRGFKP
jgi:ATP/ADP translocase